jgi:hypothetical protein
MLTFSLSHGTGRGFISSSMGNFEAVEDIFQE